MKEINKIKEESEDIIAEIRGEALNKKGWKENPDKKIEIDRRIRQLSNDFKELVVNWEKTVSKNKRIRNKT